MPDDSRNVGGRPPLPPAKVKKPVKVYMTDLERDYLYSLARRNRQDASEYMRLLLRRSINQSLHATLSVVSSIPSS
jgi:LysM repeat protein